MKFVASKSLDFALDSPKFGGVVADNDNVIHVPRPPDLQNVLQVLI
ncbi:MAG TPA: hypothetical protein VIG24_15665 [Acidimicrobiia bacterium]